MLNTDRQTSRAVYADQEVSEPARLSFSDLTGILNRQKWLVLAFCLVAGALGALYLAVTPKMYTAQATLISDPSQGQVMRLELVAANVVADPAAIESQVETIKSERVLVSVVDDLKLQDDPEFAGGMGGPLGALRAWLDPAPPDTVEDRKRSAIGALTEAVDARRSGLSYAVDVSVRSLSPSKAANLANAVADAYIEDQIAQSFNVTQRAGAWLQERIAELQKQASDADLAVLEYRSRNKLVDANGRPVSDQQLTEFNTQLGQAKQQTEAARARLEQIRAAVDSPARESAVTDALANQVIIDLRRRLSAEERREAELGRTVGATHEATRRVRAQRIGLEENYRKELRLIETGYKADLDAASAREQGVQREIDQVIGRMEGSQSALVELKQLEGRAASLHTLHDSFRQRYLVSIEQQSLPVTKTSIITPAAAPKQPSSPKAAIVLFGALMLGGGLGAGLALSREFLDRRIRTTSELERAVGVECLGVLPLDQLRREDRRGIAALIAGAPLKPSETARVFTPPIDRAAAWTALRHPFSAFAETIRNIKVSIDVGRMSSEIRLVAIVSATAGEGKSTVSLNLATSIARSGSSVLLIDGDLRKTQLTRSLTPGAKAGLVDVLSGRAKFDDVVWREAVSGAAFLPAVVAKNADSGAKLLASPAMAELLAELGRGGRFDYILIDCPPVLPVVDVRAFAHQVDGFILVAGWASTKRDLVSRVAIADYIHDKLLGAVLNKVDLRSYKQFADYDDSYYYDRSQAA